MENWFRDRETCELAFGVRAPWDVLNTIRAEYMEELQKDTTGVLSVKRVPSSALAEPDIRPRETIGFVRYSIFTKDRKRQARVGIILGPQPLRGQGLGREAFATLLHYLFSDRGITVIELDTALFNTRARACFESCGFEAIRETEFMSVNAQWKEKRLVMRLNKEKWESRSEAPRFEE